MPHSAPASKKSSTLLLLMTMTLLAVFPLDVVLPSFPALSSHFHTTPSEIAESVSIFAIGLAVSLLLIGPLSDRFGRKKLLLAGIALSAIGATGCLFAEDFAWFLGFRVVQAVGCGTFALSQALIQDLFAGRELERIRIWMTTAGGIFISSSPLMGTGLQLYGGWQASFYVFIALAIVVWLWSARLLDDSRSQHRPGADRRFRHGIALAGLAIRLVRRHGVDPHVGLHRRHHHLPAHRQLQGHEPVPPTRRHIDLCRQPADFHVRRPDQPGGQPGE